MHDSGLKELYYLGWQNIGLGELVAWFVSWFCTNVLLLVVIHKHAISCHDFDRGLGILSNSNRQIRRSKCNFKNFDDVYQHIN